MTLRLSLSAAAALALQLIHCPAAVLYVDANSLWSQWPYDDWSNAATMIQQAVDASNPGDQILVADGVYDNGGAYVIGSLLNRVAITKPVTVQSIHGPDRTMIVGYQLPTTTNGNGAVRCVFLTNNATLIGFTLTNGATRSSGLFMDRNGGGVYCWSTNAVLSNCVVIGNAAFSTGGAYQGSLYNCLLVGNTGSAGGADSSFLSKCLIAGNQARGLGGGAIGATLSSCTLLTNWARTSGGGAANSILNNCTLVSNTADSSGGGAYSGPLTNCILAGNSAGSGGGASSATLYRCVLTNNSALTNGGGAYFCSLLNCALAGNLAVVGGGAYAGGLTNCTLTGNSSLSYGGGAYSNSLNNCIIYYNSAILDPNYSAASLNFSCTKPLPTGGTGNIATEPRLAGPFRLSGASPCRAAGSALYAKGTDVDGEAWASPPSMGCDEFYPATATGPLSVSIRALGTNAVVGYPLSFTGNITGDATNNLWDFGDGTTDTNLLAATHAWGAAADFKVVLRAYNNSNPGGISATVVVHVVESQVCHVSANSPNPLAPFNSWATAARTIQEAIDAATYSGGQVLVNDGTYATGGRAMYGTMTNRVTVARPLVVQSVNGPGATFIQGAWVAGKTNGDGAVRCVCLANGAILQGFTVTNGATRAAGDNLLEQTGGGVWCQGSSVAISNCVLTGNSASLCGGGIYSGTLAKSTLDGNSASSAGGGAHSSSLVTCTLTNNRSYDGGGAKNCSLSTCILASNLASDGRYGAGGGASSCALDSCTLVGNSAANTGGGAYSGSLNNCRLLNNTAFNLAPYPSGGGASSASLTNCLLMGNWAGNAGGGACDGILVHCTLVSNTASWGGGAASYVASVLLNDCTLSGNSATTTGGGACSGTLSNCTLTGNSAPSGAGASSATLFSCILTRNFATNIGGGAFSSTLSGCFLVGNSAFDGGGNADGYLQNCTLTGNSARLHGGGTYRGTLNNCILYYNSGALGPNYSGATDPDYIMDHLTNGLSMNFCCTTPLPEAGTGNTATEPQLVDAFHIGLFSPCREAGSAAYTNGFDIDGQPWASSPSVGCDEHYPTASAGLLSMSIQAEYTNAAVGFPLMLAVNISGAARAHRWNFGDGTVVSNSPYVAHAWTSPGSYTVDVRAYNDSNPDGVSAVVQVHVLPQPIHYVSVNSPGPSPPYTSWSTAASQVQDAIDAATVPGALVLVTNGVYSSGGKTGSEIWSNRVAVMMPLTLQSVNGPEFTLIQGSEAMRCVYLADRAALAGFTLTNGSASSGANADTTGSGGGVWCAGPTSTISNCVVVGNSAVRYGGAVYSGNVINSTLKSNSAYYWNGYGGGSFYSTLSNSTLTGNNAGYGGGAYGGTINNCAVVGNETSWGGGGAGGARLNNCLVFSNRGGEYTGGVNDCTLHNCTVTGNRGHYYGGADSCIMYDCIVYYNTNTASYDAASANYDSYSFSVLNGCCTTPLPNGPGNFTNAPQFADVGTNFHLQADSPCINAGKNARITSTTDLDGNPRIAGGTVDVGTYEFQSPTSVLPYVWAQQYALATDGSADGLDPDGDGMNNWQESIAGTNPTNAGSVLRIARPVLLPSVPQDPAMGSTAATITWTSVTNRTYFIGRSSGVGAMSEMAMLQTNIAGLTGWTSYTDTNLPSLMPAFYRVGIQQ